MLQGGTSYTDAGYQRVQVRKRVQIQVAWVVWYPMTMEINPRAHIQIRLLDNVLPVVTNECYPALSLFVRHYRGDCKAASKTALSR